MRLYRNDIDGMRALAVIAVILFHFGYLPNGYLGVDVFFVISGFLITGILYNQLLEQRFAVLPFYYRRIRRILPLVIFITLVAFIIGLLVMLPSDLERLCQSIVATNIFGNNVLQYVATGDYWDVINEYKPLLHTWSLGIEEQYYILYPFLFLFFKKGRGKGLLPILVGITILSLIVFSLPYFDEAAVFYLLSFRFFELSLGGIVAILFSSKRLNQNLSPFLLIALIAFFCIDLPEPAIRLRQALVVGVSALLLITANRKSRIASRVLENPVARFIGKISFSLYMWHYLLLAFTRYAITDQLTNSHMLLLGMMTLILSVGSYYFIENPFRDDKRINNKTFRLTIILFYLITTVGGIIVYSKGGVIRDMPELDIKRSEAKRNMHFQYNYKVFEKNKEFGNTDDLKILVVGNSFARDWVNILKESTYEDALDIAYTYYLTDKEDLVNEANLIFFSSMKKRTVNSYVDQYQLDTNVVWCIGNKNFGVSNGIFYNAKGHEYCDQRVEMRRDILVKNAVRKAEWGRRYIDLLEMAMDEDNFVPIFTDNCKFISQDCKHLTKAGAAYYARLLEQDENFVLNQLVQ